MSKFVLVLLVFSSFMAQIAYGDMKTGDEYFFSGQYDKAFNEFKPLADGGNAEAQCTVGMLYYEGNGVGKDYDKAMSYFKKSAEQGNLNAQFRIGYMYEEGHGAKKSPKEAVKWYRKCAEKGSMLGEHQLGLVLYNGAKGVKINKKEGLKWIKQAAAQGNGAAEEFVANHAKAQDDASKGQDNTNNFTADYLCGLVGRAEACEFNTDNVQGLAILQLRKESGLSQDDNRMNARYVMSKSGCDYTSEVNRGKSLNCKAVKKELLSVR